MRFGARRRGLVRPYPAMRSCVLSRFEGLHHLLEEFDCPVARAPAGGRELQGIGEPEPIYGVAHRGYDMGRNSIGVQALIPVIVLLAQ